jgi:2-polyprenyl-3-methyl-5-hydroxy-6-metoxy-1,4-benzoquinol methylase
VHAEFGSTNTGLSAARAYDAIAAKYDALVAGDAWMRRALHAHYARVFRPGDRVLDIGCGTGIDAVFLAGRGIRVVGIDASARMIDQARERVRRAGVEARVGLRVLAASELGRLDVPKFEGAISAFAALSTVADLESLAAALAERVHPGGRVVVHMLNRFSTWEWLGAAVHGDWHAARSVGRACTREFRIGGERVLHHVYFPSEAAARFRPGFQLRRVYSLGAVRPPHTVRRIPRPAVVALEGLDLRLGGLPLLREAGRFFVLELERCATRS